MDIYSDLAEELIEAFDRRKKELNHKAMSASMHGELAVLRLLEVEDRQLTAGDISRMLCMTTSRVAAVLGTLEKKGLIVRRADTQDRRRIRVMLTQKGLEQYQGKRRMLKADLCVVLSRLGQNDAREFVRLFKRVHEIMPPPPIKEEIGEEARQRADHEGGIAQDEQ